MVIIEEEAAAVANPLGNAPPTIDRVELDPDSPKQGEKLVARAVATDPEGDLIRFDYAWTVDGLPVDNSGSDFTLTDVPKGSWVKVRVVARDRGGRSEPSEAQVTIANQLPIVREIMFEPFGAVTSESDLTATPRAFDPDGDEVTYDYLWRVNGTRASSEGPVLSSRRFKRGDEIVLELIANDGEDDSEMFQSDPVRIANARPRIVSTPSGFGGDRFRYLLEVEDPDGDRALRFRLNQGPDGMTIDDISGKISWVPSADQAGAHPVVVTVEDGQGGEDTQRFDLTLGFESGDVPAAPDR
jgi:hypothetical protein